MILEVTHNSNTLYIDTGMIFYAYDDSGCYLYLDVNPETLKQYGVSLNDVVIDYSVPGRVAQIQISESYNAIKTATTDYAFAEFSEANYTNIWVNCAKVIKVDDVSGDGLLWFDNYSSIQTADSVASVQLSINSKLNYSSTTTTTSDLSNSFLLMGA